jgi:hypothetical protein
MVNSLGKSVVWLIILADLIVGRQAQGQGGRGAGAGSGAKQGRMLSAAAAAAGTYGILQLLLPSLLEPACLQQSHAPTHAPTHPPICSSGDGSGLLPELLRAAGHPAAASGDAWYLRRWPWILLLTALATPAVSGKPLMFPFARSARRCLHQRSSCQDATHTNALPSLLFCAVRSLDKLSGISLVGDVAVAVMTASGMALTGEHTCSWLTVLSLPAGRCFPAQHWCACAGPRRAWRWWAQPGCGLAGCQAPGICMPQHWAVIRS